MTTQIKAGVIAANAITASELASSALSGGSFTGDVTFDSGTLYVDSTNNRVGIGETNPSRQLQISGTIGTTLYLKNSSTSVYLQLASNNYDNDNSSYIGSETNKSMSFWTVNERRMTIDALGKVGIGNTSPLGKLTISNAAGANAPTTVTAANTYLQLGSDDYGASNNGKFMIGFGYTDATNTNSPAYIGFEERSTSGDTYGDLTFYTRDVITDTAPTQRMKIDPSGRVLINNSNWEYGQLQVTSDPAGTGSFSRGLAVGFQDNVAEGDSTGISFFSKVAISGVKWENARIAALTTGVTASAYGQLAFYTMNATTLAERMTIDSSGDMHLGQSDGDVKFYIGSQGGGFGGNASHNIRASGASLLFNAGGASGLYTFEVNGSEKVRIDASGNLLVGTTSDTLSGTDEGFVFKADGNSSFVTGTGIMYMRRTSSNGTHIKFRSTSNATVGQIDSDGSNTSYVTSSDYRLKENVTYDFDALSRVQQLKPARFNFIEKPEVTQDGFIAHEVQDIVPIAVSGIKDAVDEEGNIEPQGVDHSKLVPLLTKAIQEQQTIIDDLKSRLDSAGL